ncbi:MAG: hypothetical protein AMXMBFR64_63180 [Myxococcales bacterium]
MKISVLFCGVFLLTAVGCTADSKSPVDSGGSLLTACTDERKLGDGLNPGDGCWDPPQHYCSEGAGGSNTYCAPDMSLCCSLFAYCPPCGWIECPEDKAGCPKYMDIEAAPPCKKYWADHYRVNDPVCWDGLGVDADAETQHQDAAP